MQLNVDTTLLSGKEECRLIKRRLNNIEMNAYSSAHSWQTNTTSSSVTIRKEGM
jgi:hypothetical protein